MARSMLFSLQIGKRASALLSLCPCLCLCLCLLLSLSLSSLRGDREEGRAKPHVYQTNCALVRSFVLALLPQ